MHDAPSRILKANLDRLPAATRLAIDAAPAGGHPGAVTAEAGPDRLSVRLGDGRTVPIHPSEDPLAASEAAVARLLGRGALPHLIVIGSGLGYLLDALERQAPETRVLAVEPLPSVARALLTRRDWTSWIDGGRLRLLIGPDYAGAAEAWRLFKSGLPAPAVIMSPLIEREFPGEATRARTLTAHILSGLQANEEARRRFAGRYVLNTLANLPAIAGEGDVTALRGMFAGVPAFVVGAGPSLDANLAMLATAADRALIIAVDTAARPLLSAGIRPHLIVAVDPSELNGRHLKHLPESHAPWLVAEASLDPGVLPLFARHTFLFRVSDHHPWPWLSKQAAGRGTLRAWGSVLTTAFDLACEAGCDPIVFAGADLAFSRGLQYCRNTTYESSWRMFESDEARAEQFTRYLREHVHTTLPDVHGRDVVTTPHFVQFRDWIVSRASEAADRRVMNATGAGILSGRPIDQVDGRALQLPARTGSLNARIAIAWASGAGQRRDVMRRLATPAALLDQWPVEDWLRFGGDTASAEQIDRTVRQSLVALALTETRRAQVEAERRRYDAVAASEGQARAFIHPDYSFAETQAAAQIAHMLADYQQRTHPPAAWPEVERSAPALAQWPTCLRVLDFGCGLGRAMAPLLAAGHAVDGVDFSANMLALAQQHAALAGCGFFHSGGADCGSAEDGAYDLVTSLHAFHRIRSRTQRLDVLRAMARALRPGGIVAIQLPFFPNRRVSEVPAPHVAWSAQDTSPSDGEVWPTADELPLLLEDFSRDFHDVRLQFVDFPSSAPRFGLDDDTRLCHVIVTASTRPTLAARVYNL